MLCRPSDNPIGLVFHKLKKIRTLHMKAGYKGNPAHLQSFYVHRPGEVVAVDAAPARLHGAISPFQP
jgi:hypothetical protein